MKTLVIVVVLVLAACGLAFFWAAPCGSSQAGKVVLTLPWDGSYALPVPDSQSGPDSQGGKSLRIQPRLANVYSNFKATLFRIKNPPVGYRFALEGTASYTNLPEASVLELIATSLFKTQTLETDQDDGPQRRLVGTSGPRPFVIGYGELPGGGNLLELDIEVLIAGPPHEDPATKGQPPSLTLSNLKLVRYPDPTKQDIAMAYPGLGPSGNEGWLDWKSFFLGCATAAVFGLAIAQAILLARRFRKMKADREMRQMSSLDG